MSRAAGWRGCGVARGANGHSRGTCGGRRRVHAPHGGDVDQPRLYVRLCVGACGLATPARATQISSAGKAAARVARTGSPNGPHQRNGSTQTARPSAALSASTQDQCCLSLLRPPYRLWSYRDLAAISPPATSVESHLIGPWRAPGRLRAHPCPGEGRRGNVGD